VPAVALLAVALLVVAGLTLGPGASIAEAAHSQVVLYASGYYGGSYTQFNGGEFDVKVQTWAQTDPDWQTSVATYAHNYDDEPGVYGPTQFSTFCVQTHVNFSPGTSYGAILADTTSLGNGLTHDTKALFRLWNTKALSQTALGANGYEYDDSVTPATKAQRKADAQSLQALLWYTLGEGGYAGIYNESNLHANQAAWLAAARAYNGDLTHVKVMQLGRWVGDTFVADSQNQLVDTTASSSVIGKVPEPTSLVLLAMGGLPVLPLLRRRRGSA